MHLQPIILFGKFSYKFNSRLMYISLTHRGNVSRHYKLLAATAGVATWQAADAVVDAIASWRHHWSL